MNTQNLDSGFYETTNGITINKDIEAEMVYTIDWVDWLESGDSISSVDFSITSRSNDPTPLLEDSSGISTTQTWIKVTAGALEKIYPVACKIVTANGLTERRTFRVNVINRSA